MLARLLLLLCLIPPTALAQDPCHGVSCSHHGECFAERDTPFCLCDEGYEATGVACTPAAPTQGRLRTSSVGALIVQIASAEDGHDLASVGKLRGDYPRALAQYVTGDLWCSDFVSWVYRAAGVPFTGGYHGGWLLTHNLQIKRWFQQRNLWVANGSPEWSTFTPRPGDYVRIHTPRWGHSAIVRFVDGDSLYLVEGNAGNRVRLTRYQHFRRHERIDGFGIVTLPEVRSAQRLRDALRDRARAR